MIFLANIPRSFLYSYVICVVLGNHVAFSGGVWDGGRENNHPRNGFEPISKAKNVSGGPGIYLFIFSWNSC